MQIFLTFYQDHEIEWFIFITILSCEKELYNLIFVLYEFCFLRIISKSQSGYRISFWKLSKCSYWWRMFVELGGWRILLQPSFVIQQWEYFWTIFLNPTESRELLNNYLIVMKYWNVICNWLLSLNAMQMNEVVMMRKWNSNLTMDVLYDDDGEHRIRVLFNDPIHKEEITGNKNIITQIEETKVIIGFLVFHYL